MFISVDPGLRVGVASFSDDGTDINRTTFNIVEFRRFLKQIYGYALKRNEIVRWLYEDYTLRQDKAIAQTGSDMPASRAIGSLEMVDEMMGELSTLEKCSSSNLRTALKWAGYPQLANKPRTWHCPDDLSAYAHGVKWLIDLNVRKHPIFESP
jgi:hypothetical protein